jgi:hypothetical protein
MSLLIDFDFQKVPPTTTSKKALNLRRCCLTLASRVFSRIVAHEGLGRQNS